MHSTVIVVEPTGAETELLLDVGGAKLVLVAHGRIDVRPGQAVGLEGLPAAAHVFDAASGARLD